MPEARLAYSRALEAWDHDALMASLADDVVIRVAVHDEPMKGKDVADFLFLILRDELAELRITDEIVEGTQAVVLFETRIGARAAQGLNVVRQDDSGAIRELTVFFRPLEALILVSEVIGSRMQARFGPPQGRPAA